MSGLRPAGVIHTRPSRLYQGGDVKRWWGIRHLRYWWHVAGLNLHLARWEAMGFVPILQQSDLDYLQAIWEGRE
jgi:hypothetical protein